jgi:hypothetical protein
MNYRNRELWLQRAIYPHLVNLFKQCGAKLPVVKVSVGLPSGRGSKKATGQHWCPEASDDKKGSIFISPTINDSIEVLGVFTHELVHAVVGNEAKHGPKFRRLAIDIGLSGKMTATHPGIPLRKKLREIVWKLGKYPHAKLNLAMNPVKKQTTRMIKMECDECGYIARASRKVIDEKGAAICPCGAGPLSVIMKEGDE